MRRRVLLIIVCLILGAIVNVAVAWSGSLLFRQPQTPEPMPAREGPQDWPASVPIHWPKPPVVMAGKFSTWSLVRYSAMTSHTSDQQLTVETYKIDYLSFGWPLRSLQSEIWNEFIIEGQPPVGTNRFDGHPEPSTWRQGIYSGWGLGILPLRPILPGFIINTLLYALLLWLLIATPFAARRMIRRRRGQCEECAYPIGTSPVCTECGAALPRKVET